MVFKGAFSLMSWKRFEFRFSFWLLVVEWRNRPETSKYIYCNSSLPLGDAGWTLEQRVVGRLTFLPHGICWLWSPLIETFNKSLSSLQWIEYRDHLVRLVILWKFHILSYKVSLLHLGRDRLPCDRQLWIHTSETSQSQLTLLHVGSGLI